jgi:hypothetical protein
VTTVVESIETNIRAKWDAELNDRVPPGHIEEKARVMAEIMARDLANAMARISVLEKTRAGTRADCRELDDRTIGLARCK